MTIVAVVYILVTTPLLFIFYKAIGKRYLAHGAAWRVAKAGVSLVALLILWTAILHVGVPGKEAPFGYLLSAFYAVIMGLIYVAVDRYVQQG